MVSEVCPRVEACVVTMGVDVVGDRTGAGELASRLWPHRGPWSPRRARGESVVRLPRSEGRAPWAGTARGGQDKTLTSNRAVARSASA